MTTGTSLDPASIGMLDWHDSPYLVRTADLGHSSLEHRKHPVVNTNERYQVSLGDSTGLSKTGVHLARLPAGSTSTTLHWHSHEDEWFYILEAGEDAVLLVWEPGTGETARGVKDQGDLRKIVVPREERIQAGDFLGFQGGVERAHAFRAGTKEMAYLIGGSREPLDISYYPAEGKRAVNDAAAGSLEWLVEDKHVKQFGRTAIRRV